MHAYYVSRDNGIARPAQGGLVAGDMLGISRQSSAMPGSRGLGLEAKTPRGPGPISNWFGRSTRKQCGRRAYVAHWEHCLFWQHDVQRDVAFAKRDVVVFRSTARRSTNMARIVGGIAASHTPTIGFAYDRNKRDDPVWAPIFENFAPLSAWLAEKRPDVLVLIYNDHVSSFFFDHYSAFTLGVGPEWHVADEGAGARDLPPIKGHPQLASYIGHSLMADEFDMSFFQNRALDHGCFSPLSVLCPHKPEWPVSIVPLQMGVLQFPIPSARRFYKLGQALRRAIESYPEDLRVAIAATGGLSHQVHGERAGFNNPDWDQRFLDLFERDPEQLAAMTVAEYAELGGFEGAEVVMWLTMRGALSANVECKHRSHYLPSMAGIATAIYEGTDDPNPAIVERHRHHVASELSGVERLEGTYPFTLERSVKAFRINDYMHRMEIGRA